MHSVCVVGVLLDSSAEHFVDRRTFCSVILCTVQPLVEDPGGNFERFLHSLAVVLTITINDL